MELGKSFCHNVGNLFVCRYVLHCNLWIFAIQTLHCPASKVMILNCNMLCLWSQLGTWPIQLHHCCLCTHCTLLLVLSQLGQCCNILFLLLNSSKREFHALPCSGPCTLFLLWTRQWCFAISNTK